MKDWPQHNIPKKAETSQNMIDDLVKRYGTSPGLLHVDLRILVLAAKREQMIEDHKMYMSAIKEEK